MPDCVLTNPLEIIEPQLEEPISFEAEAVPVDEQVVLLEPVDEHCPAMDGEVEAIKTPLDPASTSFYPQYPYYPMVFTPQQLPPNTSIIPLAGESSETLIICCLSPPY